MACLLAGALSEAAFSVWRVGKSLRLAHAPSLLFRTTPETKVITVPIAPPAETEMQRRLKNMGAQSGEVQVSLAWDGPNDLDLSCIEPGGVLIDGYNQQSPSGGFLDLDMNMTDAGLMTAQANAKLTERGNSLTNNHRSGTSNTPVENIVWGVGKVRVGHYKVFVHHFCNKAQTDSTPYWIEVKAQGRTKRFSGNVGREDFATNLVDPKLVYEFDVAPPDAPKPIPTPSADQVEPKFQSFARTAFSLANFWHSLASAGIWGGAIGALLPIALFLGQKSYLKERAALDIDLLKVVAFGLLAGFGAMFAAQAAMSAFVLMLPLPLASFCHILGWLVFGGVFCAAIAHLIPNTPLIPSVVVGIATAIFASVVLQTSQAGSGETVARLLSSVILGALVGILIALPKREPEPKKEDSPPEKKREPTGRKPYRVGSSRSRSVGKLRTRNGDFDD